MTKIDRFPNNIRRNALEIVETHDSMAYDALTVKVGAILDVETDRVESVLDRLEAQGEIYKVEGMVKRT